MQHAGSKAPAPVRGHVSSHGGGGGGGDAEDDEEEGEDGDDEGGVNVADLVPRNDIR